MTGLGDIDTATRARLRDVERTICDMVEISVGLGEPGERKAGLVDIRDLIERRKELKAQMTEVAFGE